MTVTRPVGWASVWVAALATAQRASSVMMRGRERMASAIVAIVATAVRAAYVDAAVHP